jgi:hypothetical protein
MGQRIGDARHAPAGIPPRSTTPGEQSPGVAACERLMFQLLV